MLCPEQYTTLIDFIYKYKSLQHNNFDFIFLHCSIVDFSCRPIVNADYILKNKENKVNRLFGVSISSCNKDRRVGKIYHFKKTTTIYNDFLLENIISEILKILSETKIYYITRNKLATDWDGNYKKGRPKDLSSFLETEDYFIDRLSVNQNFKVIDLRHFSLDFVKKFTLDNIHFNHAGHILIEAKISELFESKS